MNIIGSQDQLLTLVRKGDDRAISSLYKDSFAYCASFILKNEGNREDAKDVFQRAFMVLIEKLKDDNFELEHTVKSYLFGVSRYLWLGELKAQKKGRMIPVQETIQEAIEFGEEDVKELRFQAMYKAMKKLSEDCQKLIQLTFFKEMKDKEIAPIMQYSNDFVRNKRRRCMKNLKKIIGT